jgi:DGQHR domain-containing protein
MGECTVDFHVQKSGQFWRPPGSKKVEPIDLYVSVIDAETLVTSKAPDGKPRFRADQRIPGTNQGYQRQLAHSRTSAIDRFVRGGGPHGGGLMPGAILLNVREGAVFTPDNGGSYGTLHVPDDEPVYITDGQHRVGGLAETWKHPGDVKLGEYGVPVVFTTLDSITEIRAFYVVNKEARSVPTDLTSELLADIDATRVAAGETISLPRLRKDVGTYIGKRLAEEAGPWSGKIRRAEEGKENIKVKAIGISQFGASMHPVLTDAWVTRRLQESAKADSMAWREVYEVVRSYWTAITDLMPVAAGDRASYALQKPLGAYVFNALLPEFLDLARQSGDFSPGFFRSELERLGYWVEDATWFALRDDDKLREQVMLAMNRQSIQWIVAQCRALLRENPSTQVQELVLPGGDDLPEG